MTPDQHRHPHPVTGRRLVWDLPLRLFHWLFAFSVVACYTTAQLGFNWMQLHMRLGYGVIGLLAFRVIWGFVGPRHARFGSFLKPPAMVATYARGLLSRTAVTRHSSGHNPLGGIMVVWMLLIVAAQVCTGLFATDDIAWDGPYFTFVSNALAERLTALHHANVNLIVGTVALHVSAIVYYAWFKGQPLLTAMIIGTKPASAVPDDEAIQNSQLLKALIVAAVASLAVYLLLAAASDGAPATSDF